jgi:hypothetical protein
VHLYPTLVAVCFEDRQNLDVVGRELDLKFLHRFIQKQLDAREVNICFHSAFAFALLFPLLDLLTFALSRFVRLVHG